jgi:hypothetical protein
VNIRVLLGCVGILLSQSRYEQFESSPPIISDPNETMAQTTTWWSSNRAALCAWLKLPIDFKSTEGKDLWDSVHQTFRGHRHDVALLREATCTVDEPRFQGEQARWTFAPQNSWQAALSVVLFDTPVGNEYASAVHYFNPIAILAYTRIAKESTGTLSPYQAAILLLTATRATYFEEGMLSKYDTLKAHGFNDQNLDRAHIVTLQKLILWKGLPLKKLKDVDKLTAAYDRTYLGIASPRRWGSTLGIEAEKLRDPVLFDRCLRQRQVWIRKKAMGDKYDQWEASSDKASTRHWNTLRRKSLFGPQSKPLPESEI